MGGFFRGQVERLAGLQVYRFTGFNLPTFKLYKI
jgi:hypothetical protein